MIPAHSCVPMSTVARIQRRIIAARSEKCVADGLTGPKTLSRDIVKRSYQLNGFLNSSWAYRYQRNRRGARGGRNEGRLSVFPGRGRGFRSLARSLARARDSEKHKTGRLVPEVVR